MPYYEYNARSRTGEKSEGLIEASDKRTAMTQLERKGLVPTKVTEASQARVAKAKGKGKGRTFVWGHNRVPRMKTREVLMLSREMSDLLSSGMKLGNALNTLSKRESGHDQDFIIAALRDDIIQGTSLSEALAKHPKTFNQLYVSMVEAGEASGAVPETLERLCRHMELVESAREKVMMAMIYPAIVLIAGTATLILSMVFVIPRFSQIFEDLGSNMPLPTKILIGMSDVMVKYGWILMIMFGVGFVLFRRMLNTAEGRKWWDGAKLKLPLLKPILTASSYSQFARTLGGLMENGVPVLEALTIVENTVGNAVIAGEVREAGSRVTDGSTISGPLAAGRKFPRLLTDMLAVGEESGNMSGALNHIANRYEHELDRSVKVMTSLLEPIMMLLMALAIGFVAVSMLLAVFEMSSGLSM